MTTPKEALTYISNARWDENADLDDICTMADRALVSFEGDAVEKVARIIDPHSFMDIPFTDDHVLLDMVEQSKNDALHKARRILATGLVPDEAAIRGDWHTTGWDRARNSGRILLAWREFSGVREHVELGRYSDSKSAWVNTYGHPFHADPDGWAPLLPFKTAEAIRTDEREKCAAEVERRNWPNVGDARRIAGAIRSGGGE